MGMGFSRRLAGLLAGAFLLAFLPPGSGPAAGSPQGEARSAFQGSWEVRLILAARGEYAVRGGGAPLAGEYSCRALWEGRLEPDGDDFLLIHIKTDILEWRLHERSGPPGRESLLEAPAAVRPDLLMRYVLKDGREIEFVFELAGVSIPLHAWPFAVDLEMPRASARTSGFPGHGYGDFVCRGSSRVVIPETDLLARSPERRFSWDWRRERKYFRAGRYITLIQSHTAEATIALARR